MQAVMEKNPPRAPLSNKHLADSIGRNTVFGIAANMAQMGTRLITVPLVIAHLGIDGYGIWSIIMVITAYMRFGSAGIKSAFQKYVADATGNGDFDRANKLLSTGTAAILMLSVVALTPIAIFSRSLGRTAGVPDLFLNSAAGAISLLALTMVLSNVGAVYHAIVMGAHRIDLTRKFNIISTIFEAIAILALLHLGYGLLAMSAVMAVSEIGYLICCFFASRCVLPEIQIGRKHLSRAVLPELVTFAGSYQLVSILEIFYAAILPVALLKFYGPSAAGVYAVATRLVTAALFPQNALLLPLLSGGSMVYASGSMENMRLLFAKAFKVTIALTILPLAFIAVFGKIIALAWIGQVEPSFRVVLWLTCLAGLFKGPSALGRILYRASGKSLIDNLQQVLMIVILVCFIVFSNQLGFFGVLAGVVLGEFMGMVLMMFAVAGTCRGLTTGVLVVDTLKLAIATLAILAFGAIVAGVPLPWSSSERVLATIKLGVVSLASLVALWPALLLSGSLSGAEARAIGDVFRNKSYANI